MTPAVVFDGVWKKFRRGERHDSLRDLVASSFRRLGRRRSAGALDAQEFWALEDVSFEVRPGEALGIIGSNGAGKSTTLKLLTKILKPSKGRSEIEGRVGALIEVAAGFHPDLTGRENVFLQGAVMGMKRAEIARTLDAIIEFAGVADFIDTPVKRYSSGMNARLGFSIAAHLNPHVLLIDEVLAVGDMAFQEKCVARMKAFKQSGVAIVFVSHNLAAVSGLCERTLLLNSGRVRFLGDTGSAITSYLADSNGRGGMGAGDAVIEHVSVTDREGRPVSVCRPGVGLRLKARVRFMTEARGVTFGFGVHQSATGIYAYGVNTGSLGLAAIDAGAGDVFDVSFDFTANLTRGQYMLELHAVHAPTLKVYALGLPAAVIGIEESLTPRGVADLNARCVVSAELARVSA